MRTLYILFFSLALPVFANAINLTPQHLNYTSLQVQDSVLETKKPDSCNWSKRGNSDCKNFVITEWGVKVTAHDSFTPPHKKPIATIEYGYIHSMSKNSGLGWTLYLATGEDWRIGPRLRYRRWFNDYLALDISLGITWNSKQREVRKEIQGKAGFAGSANLNFTDIFILSFEYDIYQGWNWQSGEIYGYAQTQHEFYVGATVGSKYGGKMILISALLVILAMSDSN